MSTKRTIKTAIDLVMTLLLLILMAYYITGNTIHEILGTSLFILFILHNILNINWYKSLFKGKYNSRRIIHLVINTLLTVTILLMITSGIIISNTVFSFIQLGSVSSGRKIHLLATSWGYILLSAHIGLHWYPSIKKLPKKINISIVSLICINGLYALIKRNILQTLFLINQYAFFNYNEPPIIFIIDYLSIMILIISITHLLTNKYLK